MINLFLARFALTELLASLGKQTKNHLCGKVELRYDRDHWHARKMVCDVIAKTLNPLRNYPKI